MGKHRRKNSASGFNIGDILKNIDITQLLSVMSSLGGSSNISNDQLGSMLRDLDLGDIAKGSGSSGFNDADVKDKLSALENRLSKLEKGKSGIQDEVLRTIKDLQSSPDAAKMLNEFMKSNFNNSKEDRRKK